MIEHESKPILVTGSHRSGSTWVGRVLAQAPGTGYIHEPFNPGQPPGICAAPFKHWFTYVTEENEDSFLGPLRDTLRFRYAFRSQLVRTRSLRDLYKLTRDAGRFGVSRVISDRAIVKDPIAVLSTPWLQRRFALRVVVVVRHPAAFANSLKRAGWKHPFSHFLSQPLLMRDYLSPYRQELEAAAQTPPDIIDQATLLWKLISSVLDTERASNPDWLFIRHEDISRDPINEFAWIFDHVDLAWTPKVVRFISQSSARGNRLEGRADKHVIHRDSKKNVTKWQHQLTTEEIGRIRDGLGELAGVFYQDQDW